MLRGIFFLTFILCLSYPLLAQNGGEDTQVTQDDNNDSFFSSIDWNGNEFGVVWEDERDGNFEIYFTRLDAKGNKKANDIRITSNDAASLKPDIRWTGSQYGVTWHDDRDGNEEIYFTAIDFLGNKLTSDIRITNSNGESSFASLIWTGEVFGIAWQDDRDYSPGSGNYEIYFTRVAEDGFKLGSDIRATSYASIKGNPSLGWDGVDYGVAWEDDRDGNFEIYYARLDESGNEQDSDVRITDSEGDSVNPSIQWNGVKYGLVWQDNSSTGLTLQLSNNIYYNGIDSIGDKEGDDSLITSSASNSTNPTLAWANGEWGVAFADDRDGDEEIYHARLTPDGVKKADEERMTNAPEASDYPEIVWNGEDYGMTWQDLRNGTSYEVYFEEICGNSEKLGPDIRVTNNSSSYRPSLVWSGSEYGISWYHRDEIYFARLDSSGNKIGSDVRVTYNYPQSRDPSLVWTGTEYGVAWYEWCGGDREIFFARIDSIGNKIGSDVRVTYDSSFSGKPSLVWNGSGYGVSWLDDRDGRWEIYFARLDSSGNKIGPDVDVTITNWGSPSLVWSGSEYGVSWTIGSEIYFARLDSTGNKIGSNVRVTYDSSYSGGPSLVWSGAEYGIAWIDERDGNYEIYFARLDSTGNKISSDVRITNNSLSSGSSSLVYAVNEYGISWVDNRDGSSEIYLARLDSYGNKVGSDERVTYNPSIARYPSLVWSGSEYGVSWVDERNNNSEIYFVLIGCCLDKFDNDKDKWCWRDCNDNDSSVYPGAPELCSGIDNDCDGTKDNKDSDNDGYIDDNCSGGNDCDDENSDLHPGIAEIICNGLDENCDFLDDAPDNDGDGYDTCGYNDINNPDNLERDCNDANSYINTDEIEVCNGYDDNCNSVLDEGCDTVCDYPRIEVGDVRITYNSTYSGRPSLVWTGREYGVSWEEWSYYDNYEIYFARIDSIGKKIGSGIRVTYDPSYSRFPSLVWTGSEYSVSWSDNRDNNAEIYLARIDSSGNKIGSDVRVTYNSFGSSQPSLVWSGSAYGLSWQNGHGGWPYNNEIYFARLDPNGKKIGDDTRLTYAYGYSSSPSLVWTGSEYGVSWKDERPGDKDQIYFARLDSIGNKIGSDLRITYHHFYSRNPSLAWTGSEYGVSWEDFRDGFTEIYFARIDSSGQKIGSDVRVTYSSIDDSLPYLVWSGSEYGISWRGDWWDGKNWNYEIYFAKLDSTGNKIGSDTRLTHAYGYSSHPSLVRSRSEYGVSWYDDLNGNPAEIYFAEIKCNLDPQAYAGEDSEHECTSSQNALVLLDGSASKDLDSTAGTNDDIVLFEWFENFGQISEMLIGEGEIIEAPLSLGEHTITLKVTDRDDQTDIDEVIKTVIDTTPPDIQADLKPVMPLPEYDPNNFIEFDKRWKVEFSAFDVCDDELETISVMKIPDVPPEAIINYLPSPDSEYSEINFYISGEAKQWASSANASSQYGDPLWGAVQATGEPDTFACDDFHTAWAPLSDNPDPEFLEVFFDKNVYATGIEIYETYIGGFVFQVDLIDMDDNYHTIWSGIDTTVCPGVFVLKWPKTTYPVKGARIHTSIDGWEEIDAVGLRGFELVNPSINMEIECKGADESMLMELLNGAISNGGFSVSDGDILYLSAKPTSESSDGEGIPVGDPNGQDIVVQKRLTYSFGFSNEKLIREHAQGPSADCVLYVKATDHGYPKANTTEKEVSLIETVEEICEDSPDDIICKTR